MTDIDGAGDKLFTDESSNSLKDHVEVKFVSPDNTLNGDAKINIDNLKSTFAGMGKEELMKFANDPFWVRLRWLLFIGFWLVWLGMLFGAIAIIIYAPKCGSATPKEYFDISPLYQIDIKTFKDGDNNGVGDLKGVTSKLDYFKGLGIKQISISSVLKSNPEDSNGDEVIDFKNVNPVYGSLDDFKDLVTKSKAAGIHVILPFSPDYSSIKHEFFQKSIKKEKPYDNFYIWAPDTGVSSDGSHIPPNNWKSLDGGSAWEWNEERKEFYLHQFGKNLPEFNFHNPEVVNYFNDVFEFWLKEVGVSGFHLKNVEYLLEDQELKNETIGEEKDTFPDDYKFYSHFHTKNVNGIANILDTWGKTIHNQTGAVLIVGNALSENSSSVNLVVHPLEISSPPSAIQMKKLTDGWSKEFKPTWQWTCSDGTMKCLSNNQLLDLYNMAAFLLPGTPIVRNGEELGLIEHSEIPWDTNSNSDINVETQLKDPFSHYALYKNLVVLREQPAIQYGSFQSEAYNGSVYAFTRIKSGNPAYLVAVNLNQTADIQVDFSRKLQNIPTELKVVFTSRNISSSFLPNSTLSSTSVQLPAMTGAVFSFAPLSAA